MIKCKINNISYEFKPNITIMQACSSLNIDIPRFCFHERLSIAGNCRMCLVEVKNTPKPIASCAMPLMNNMDILTNTIIVKKAREGILEFLLANHPLDCPICDQGSECDLQDQTIIYGTDRGRFYEIKRAVEDKDFGPLVKTIMTRCIHCTRCIRFTTEIGGVNMLGLTGRGSQMEVGTYIQNIINSELSGNIIDLCPVGALTSKPFAFTARAWELNGIDSIDIFDALGSNIKLDCRGAEVMRVLPRVNDLINEEWISDKVRFSYDGLKRQRIIRPLIKQYNSLQATDWVEAINFIKFTIQKNYTNHLQFFGFAGETIDIESIVAFKDFLLTLDNNANLMTSFNASYDFRNQYLFNDSLLDLDKTDVCLIIGSNVKLDSPVLNARFRKLFLQNNVLVATVGGHINLTYNTYHLGNNLNILIGLIEGAHWFCNRLIKAKNPLIIIGSSLLYNKHSLNYNNILQIWIKQFNRVNKNLKNCLLNVLPLSASYVGLLDVGFNQNINCIETVNSKNISRIIFALDTVEPLYKKRVGDFIIYIGHHGDSLLNKADIILPSCTFNEKDGYYVNLLGIVQKSRFVTTPPEYVREDWKIFFFILLKIFDNVFIHSKYTKILYKDYYINSSLKRQYLRKRVDEVMLFIEHEPLITLTTLNISYKNNNKYYYHNIPIFNKLNNYYMTDSITKASLVMASCSEKFILPVSNYIL
jgi:NADH-quinone oxidoreductase chain G